MVLTQQLVCLVTSVVAVVTLTPPGAAGVTPPLDAPADPAVPVLAWRPCPDGAFVGRECATAAVPLDYDRPDGRTTGLALVRIPAADPAHRIGSVFVNPGGPGVSARSMLGGGITGFGSVLARRLGGRFDIVGFDPRGVGGSSPVHCFDSAREESEFFAGLPRFPYAGPAYRPFFDRAQALTAACHDDGEAVVDHMSTANVARDLDLLRRAVGDPQLTYLGFSYGSYLGTTYANLFPGRVRAMALDGVLDPRLWSAGRQVRHDRTDTARALKQFLRLCDAAGDDCWLGLGQVSPRRRWHLMATALRRRPLEAGDGSTYTYDALLTDVATAMTSPETWGGPEGFQAYLASLADAILDDAPRVGSARRAVEADYPNGYEAYYGNRCADTAFPSTLGAFRAVDRYAARGSRFGPFWWWHDAPCASWPVDPDRYTGPWSATTSTPVLIVGSRHDAVTGYRGARAVSGLLAGSRLLTYAGVGHTAYSLSECVRSRVDGYLLSGALPPRGTVCPAGPNPLRSDLPRPELVPFSPGRPPVRRLTW